jgi:hypothetical protein
MTTTWASFLSNIRAYLQDEGDNPKFSDSLIYLYTCDALRDYSQWFPKETRVEIDPVDGVYPFPSDFEDVLAIECPEDTYLKRRLARPGYKYKTLATPTHFWETSSGIEINTDSDDSIFLTYSGCHNLPSSAEDDTFEFTVPERDMELINIYVRAQCLEQTRTRQSNLDRFRRRGERDDNPMIYETHNLMDEYLAKIAERSKGGVIYLYQAD